MFISQTAAIDKLRELTGLSEATCEKAVKDMPKKKDGCREKVHTKNLTEIADWMLGVKEVASGSVKKPRLSRRARMRIRNEQ